MLDLAPIEVHLEGRLGKKLLVILLALLSAVAILTGLGFFTYNTFIMPTTARGTCFILEPDQCSSLTTQRIEEESGITLPPGTVIVKSGSSKNFKWLPSRRSSSYRSAWPLGPTQGTRESISMPQAGPESTSSANTVSTPSLTRGAIKSMEQQPPKSLRALTATGIVGHQST